MHNLRYLPIAKKDLTNIIEYISNKSIKAALNLIDEFDQSISRLKQFPYSCKINRVETMAYKTGRKIHPWKMARIPNFLKREVS